MLMGAICLVTGILILRTRALPIWSGYVTGACAATFASGAALRVTLGTAWIVAPLEWIFLFWFVLTSVALVVRSPAFARRFVR